MTYYINTTNEGGVTQIFVDGIKSDIYVRCKWNRGKGVVWSEWKKLLTTESVVTKEENYADLSMFEKIGVIGDSFASGVIYTGTEGEDQNATHYNLSWPQNLARQCGIECINYSVGGTQTRDFLTMSNRGMRQLLSDVATGNKCGLYILCYGINDSNATRPVGGLSYLGTSADIDDENYNNNADTFWGNYGKIIAMIKEANPKAKIVMSTFCRRPTPATAEGYVPFNNAIAEIADYFNIPCINLTDDDFFNSSFYLDGMVNAHPTAPLYSGYAKAINRLMSRCMIENYSYFKDYIGV